MAEPTTDPVSETEEGAIINSNPQLQRYYYSLESRVGYRVFLGGTRHFGYYPSKQSWPVPVGRSLRAMEEHLYQLLDLPRDSTVLDAGCGVGHVAMYMASKGLRVDALDVVQHHVDKAKSNVRKAGLQEMIKVRRADYHHLDQFASNSLDGVYTMETFVHATDPQKVLNGFMRVLKPGGKLAMHEYDHNDLKTAPKYMADSMSWVNTHGAMPMNELSTKGYLREALEEAGFEVVEFRDISDHIMPMLWLFYLFAIIPYYIIKVLGVEEKFVNTVAGYKSYLGMKEGFWSYIAISARKPLGSS